MSLDVTPVGSAAGAHVGDGRDPFTGAAPPRRGGRLLIVAGALLVVGGLVALAAGILEAVGDHGALKDDAVARGTVAEDRTTPVAFTVPAGGRRDYTVYAEFGGLLSNDALRDLAVRDTACVARMPDGVLTRFRGARQGTAVTLGDASSVGHFSSLPGSVAVACRYTTGTRTSRRTRPAAMTFLVTPGKPSFLGGGVLLIVGGVAAETLGGLAVAAGVRRRRRATSAIAGRSRAA